MRTRHVLIIVVIGFAALAGCNGNGDDSADDTADRVEDTVRDTVEDATESARDAWASWRTGFERLVDDAATGDDDARDELLDECRDTLEDLRQADDPDADKVGDLCDRMRNADDDSAWDDVKSDFEDLDSNR